MRATFLFHLWGQSASSGEALPHVDNGSRLPGMPLEVTKLEVAGALTGDRHQARALGGGRVLVSFRDTGLARTRSGDWVGWIGTLDDVLEAQGADARVLARAYAALGDSLYALGKARSESGDAPGAKGIYERARLAYMRGVVSYPFEYGYVARSAVGAGLCFVALEDEDYQDNARSLFRFVRRKFKGTDWADQARKAENLL